MTETNNQNNAGLYTAYKLVSNCKRMYTETFTTRRKCRKFLKVQLRQDFGAELRIIHPDKSEERYPNKHKKNCCTAI